MDIKYKSSSFATYIQYIASPLIVFMFLYYLFALFTGKALAQEEYFFLPFWAWASVVVIINMMKLRYIKVTENNIIAKSLREEETIDYKDIIWINQNIFGSNWYILLIKYRNIKTGKDKVIITFPEMYSIRERLTMFGELNITKYIREQIIKMNPSYDISNEPSRWFLALWMLISVAIILLISFTFFV